MGAGVIEPVQKKREAFLKARLKDTIRFQPLDKVNAATQSDRHLICTDKDIDSIAEKMQQNALKHISLMEDELAEKIAQLLRCGYKKVFLTSDHGFVLTGLLAEADKIEFAFCGKIEKRERYVRTVEKQRLPGTFVESGNQYQDFNYICFHKSCRPFKTPGLYGYAHGGIAPQELITPFLKVEPQHSSVAKLKIEIVHKEKLKDVVSDNFEIKIQSGSASEDMFAHATKRKVVILFMADGKEINKDKL